jgi:hypothetical protein
LPIDINARRADIAPYIEQSASKTQKAHLDEVKPRDVGSAGI